MNNGHEVTAISIEPEAMIKRHLINQQLQMWVNTRWLAEQDFKVSTRLGETDKAAKFREQVLDAEKHIAAYQEILAEVDSA